MSETCVKVMTVARLQAILQKLEEQGLGDLNLYVATIQPGWLALVNVALESTPEGYDYIDLLCISQGEVIP